MSSIFLSSLDCFTNDNGVFGARESIQFNRYAQNDNDEVITIGLCENELQTGWDCLAYVMRDPDFTRVTSGNGIAPIIVSTEREQEIVNIPRVALNCDPNIPADGQDLELVGWGLTSNAPNPADAIKIQTAALNTRFQGTPTITNDMLCAKQEGISVSPGDSGMRNSLA